MHFLKMSVVVAALLKFLQLNTSFGSQKPKTNKNQQTQLVFKLVEYWQLT